VPDVDEIAVLEPVALVAIPTSWHTRLMLREGQRAPGFVLDDQNGHTVDLADLAGRWVLLWWYPKAATPG